jgi:hypothetical protein
MSGDTLLFMPGDEVPVDIQDQGNGLPERRDVVEITGEGTHLTEVGVVNSQGDEGIGIVSDVASDVDGNPEAGPGTILITKPVAILEESTDGSTAAGDEVQEDAGGGVVGFDGATTQTSTPLGQVFAANAGKYGFGKGNTVAVALYR